MGVGHRKTHFTIRTFLVALEEGKYPDSIETTVLGFYIDLMLVCDKISGPYMSKELFSGVGPGLMGSNQPSS